MFAFFAMNSRISHFSILIFFLLLQIEKRHNFWIWKSNFETHSQFVADTVIKPYECKRYWKWVWFIEQPVNTKHVYVCECVLDEFADVCVCEFNIPCLCVPMYVCVHAYVYRYKRRCHFNVKIINIYYLLINHNKLDFHKFKMALQSKKHRRAGFRCSKMICK